MGVAKLGQRKKMLNAINRHNICDKKSASMEVGKDEFLDRIIEEAEVDLVRPEGGEQNSFLPEPSIELSLDQPQSGGEGNSQLLESECSAKKIKSNLFVKQ